MQALDGKVYSLQAGLVTQETRTEVAEVALASQDKVMPSCAFTGASIYAAGVLMLLNEPAHHCLWMLLLN